MIGCCNRSEIQAEERPMNHKEEKKAPLVPCRLLSKGKQWDTDIRVNISFIGMSMMAVMFIDPPAPTPAQRQIACHKTGKFKQSRAAKDLPVATIVSYEPDLGKNKSQKDCVEQLEPGVLENDEASDTES